MNREQLDKLHQVAICSLNETQRAVDNATTAVIAGGVLQYERHVGTGTWDHMTWSGK